MLAHIVHTYHAIVYKFSEVELKYICGKMTKCINMNNFFLFMCMLLHYVYTQREGGIMGWWLMQLYHSI